MENEKSLKKLFMCRRLKYERLLLGWDGSRQGYYRLSSHFHWDSDRTFISGCRDNKNVKNGGFSGLHGKI